MSIYNTTSGDFYHNTGANRAVTDKRSTVIGWKTYGDSEQECFIGKLSDGHLYIVNGNDQGDNIRISAGNGGQYLPSTIHSSGPGFNASDDRLKHNETPIINALENIRKLKGLKYIKTTKMYDANHDFTLDASGKPITDDKYYNEHGFIAQEVLKIDDYKDFVYTNSDNEISPLSNQLHPFSLNYTGIFVNGIIAIQELDKQFQEKISELKTENTRLSTEISMIRTHIGI